MSLKGTTIVAVKRNGKCAIAGDGQVTLGEKVVMKGTAKKVRRLYNDKVVVGFAGSVADAFSLCERFEAKLTPVQRQPEKGSRILGAGVAQRQGVEAA